MWLLGCWVLWTRCSGVLGGLVMNRSFFMKLLQKWQFHRDVNVIWTESSVSLVLYIFTHFINKQTHQNTSRLRPLVWSSGLFTSNWVNLSFWLQIIGWQTISLKWRVVSWQDGKRAFLWDSSSVCWILVFLCLLVCWAALKKSTFMFAVRQALCGDFS